MENNSSVEDLKLEEQALVAEEKMLQSEIKSKDRFRTTLASIVGATAGYFIGKDSGFLTGAYAGLLSYALTCLIISTNEGVSTNPSWADVFAPDRIFTKEDELRHIQQKRQALREQIYRG